LLWISRFRPDAFFWFMSSGCMEGDVSGFGVLISSLAGSTANRPPLHVEMPDRADGSAFGNFFC
jgi:hypothetical protein